MHAMSNWKIMLLLPVVAALTLTNAGCPPPAPPPEAVLAGTWTLTTEGVDNPALTQVLLNFDSNGKLVSVSYVFQGGAQATQTLSNTTTTVDGNNVTISSSGLIFTLNFTGTLNEAQDTITGNASFTLKIGGTTITKPAGAATLTKGTTPPPPAEAVLAGTWTLQQTSPNPNLTAVLLNFNNSGDLVSVTYTFQNAQATQNLSDTSTTVNGNNVTITSGGTILTLNFTGTLNAAKDTITGTASWALTIGGTTITVPAGAATLVKGTVPVGDAAAGQQIWNTRCAAVCHNGVVAPVAANVDESKLTNPGFHNITGAHASITLTDQEIANVKAFLATQ